MLQTTHKDGIKIALCIITKGDCELDTLKICIQSALPAVDDVYITANGSETKKTKKYCDKNGFFYSYFKWIKDFSAARNFNFQQAESRQKYDYILWLDSDDELVAPQELRNLAITTKQNSYDVVFFDYWYGCRFSDTPSYKTISSVDIIQPRERLISPGTNVWKGRLHETPVPVEGKEIRYTKYSHDPKENRNIVVVHRDVIPMSYLDTEKFKRNQELLELQLEDERSRGSADPRTLLYLMKIYVEMDEKQKWQKVLDMGEEYLERSGWDEERGVANVCMAQALVKLGRSNEAINRYHMSLEEWPYNPETQLHLATLYYNMKQYSKAQYWLAVAMEMSPKNPGRTITNLSAMKELAGRLNMGLAFNVEKNIDKAATAAKALFDDFPTQENAATLNYIEDIKELNSACKNVDLLSQYLDSIGESTKIPKLLDTLPIAISSQAFAIKLRNTFIKPKVWDTDEIAYFANFGKAHFFKWDGNSLRHGVGGSETAVIRLSEEWVKLGYKVTVYGDPESPCEINGVKYVPWYYFNKNDEFNIFIQWRHCGLAGKAKAKKFLVDLHDVFSQVDYTQEQLAAIDKIMVKSRYHRNLAPAIPDEKFLIISNGI